MSSDTRQSVSLQQVAREAGVSAATASRALSGRGQVSETSRARVMAVAEQLGYVVSAAASSLASGRTRSIGVMTPNLNRWYFNTVLSGIAEALTPAGYDLTLYNVTDSEQIRREIFSASLRRRRVDAVIVIALELDAQESEQLLELGMPVLVIGGTAAGLPSMAIDDHQVTRLATEHLLQLGHRRLGFLGASEVFDADFRVPSRRREGFDLALEQAKVSAPAAYTEAGDFTIAGGYQLAKNLLGTPAHRVTGLVAASDEMAIGAMLAARDLGLQVPEQLSVVGIDGHELGELMGLTTVDQHPQQQGRTAAEVILATLENDERAVSAHLPHQLVVRRSSTAPRQSE